MNQHLLETVHGLFGPISISKNISDNTLYMQINNEIEGQAFLTNDGKPGAIAASRYLYGFILPAWHFPSSHGLMLGLGSGIGVTMLLALFPALSLTVVEIDPEIIKLTKQYFPLVSFYEGQGRLRIVQDDARRYLNEENEAFSFCLLDIFSGNEDSRLNTELLTVALKRSSCVMANIITSKNIKNIAPQDFFWIRTDPNDHQGRSNWMLTNLKKISPDISSFKLFSSDFLHAARAIETANHYFHYILSQVHAARFYN